MPSVWQAGFSIQPQAPTSDEPGAPAPPGPPNPLRFSFGVDSCDASSQDSFDDDSCDASPQDSLVVNVGSAHNLKGINSVKCVTWNLACCNESPLENVIGQLTDIHADWDILFLQETSMTQSAAN